jgi:hypothetical protein
MKVEPPVGARNYLVDLEEQKSTMEDGGVL